MNFFIEWVFKKPVDCYMAVLVLSMLLNERSIINLMAISNKGLIG